MRLYCLRVDYTFLRGCAKTPLLVEAYYKINVNEFFSLTPAVIYADNDSGVGNQENLYGVLRTSFSF